MGLDWADEVEARKIEEWHPWKKRFAWLPTYMSEDETIWLKTYYSRDHIFIDRFRKNGTLLDVIKDGN